MPRRVHLLWLFLGLLFLLLLIYGWGLSNPFVRWDDGLLVYENPAVRQISFANLRYIFTHYDPELYIPLTFLSYQFDYLVGGGSTFPFHLGNLLLHTFNAFLAGWIAFLLTRKEWMGIALGLVFALHPLHTEAVMWVSARKDVLSAFFFLLSIVQYLFYRDRGGKVLYWGSVAAFALGLLAKVMIIPLPVVLVLLDLRERRTIDRRMILDKIPFVIVALILGLVAVLGKTGVIQSSSLSSKILMACLSSVFYIKQILLPLNFSLLYPYVKTITITSSDFYVPMTILACITAGAVVLWRRTREPLTWFLFFLVMVAPSFVNFSKGDLDTYFASDRYVYLGSFGILMLVFMALDWAAARYRWSGGVVTGIIGIACLGLGAKAYAQSTVWANTETLFGNVIREYPDASHVAYNNIGNVLRLRGDIPGAIENYQHALTIRPHSKVYSNLGAAERKRGDAAAALVNFQEALRVNPASKDARFGMGLLLADQGRYADAIAQYRLAIETDPLYEEAYTNMGVAYAAAGQKPEAIAAYRQALAINPYLPDAHYNLAIALTETGETEEAIAEYEQVTALAPNFVAGHLNLGLLYVQTGKNDLAREQFEVVLRISPENAAAREMLRRLQ